jgi:hypothetical protein
MEHCHRLAPLSSSNALPNHSSDYSIRSADDSTRFGRPTLLRDSIPSVHRRLIVGNTTSSALERKMTPRTRIIIVTGLLLATLVANAVVIPCFRGTGYLPDSATIVGYAIRGTNVTGYTGVVFVAYDVNVTCSLPAGDPGVNATILTEQLAARVGDAASFYRDGSDCVWDIIGYLPMTRPTQISLFTIVVNGFVLALCTVQSPTSSVSPCRRNNSYLIGGTCEQCG